MNNHNSAVLTGIATYVIWIALSVVAVFVAWQWNGATLAVAAWVISKPALRPAGWNTSTLGAVQRLLVLIYGGLWLMGIMFMENLLRTAARERWLYKQSAWLVLILAIAWLIGVALPLLLR